MDWCITSKVAMATARHLITAVFLLLISSHLAFGKTQSTSLSAGQDYLLKGNSTRGEIISRSATQSSTASQNSSSSQVGYRTFNGTNLSLEAHNGKFVALLLPTEASGGSPFTEDHIEELVDRLDILYTTFQEMVRAEPAGKERLTIAFVPESCAVACGYIGAKGIEISVIPDNYQNIIADLQDGKMDDMLIHEMAHNFDLYAKYLSYLPDHAHAWTDMFEFFTPYRFGRDSNNQQQPDNLYQSPPSSIWKAYLADDSASWENCVRDQLCRGTGLSENHLWAMIYYRVEAFHGPKAILKSFEYLKDYALTHLPPAGVQGKEDLRLMSLAHGANANIACYLDTLKWTVSPALRTEMQATFGNDEALCADNDQDGYSVMTGDCDDSTASRSPSALELTNNGLDDDCDDLKDESTLIEDMGADLPGFSSASVRHSLPLELRGELGSIQDRDGVSFSIPANGLIEVNMCAEDGFKGWVVPLQANGQFLPAEYWFEYLSATGCSRKVFDFGSQTSGSFEVQADQQTGKYSLSISPADNLPADHSGLLKVVPAATRGMNIMINDREGTLSQGGADEVEIWISGVAQKVIVPYSAQMSIALNATSASGLINGEYYQARVRPLKDGLPLAGLSAGHSFRYQAVSGTPFLLDDTFSGVWYDSSHNGEGLVVEVHDDGRALVYWFTYNKSGEQRWMLGTGNVHDNVIEIDELMSTRGGRFGDQFDPNDVYIEPVGSLSIAFLDCNTADLNYTIENIGGHQRLERLSEVYGHSCEGPDQSLDQDISGSWYDPLHSGEGFIVEQLSEEQALVFWFSYDADGKQAWMINTGTMSNGRIAIDELLQPVGGIFGRSFDPESVVHHPWGELDLQLNCDEGSANYNGIDAQYSSGNQQLLPLTRLQNSSCK